MQVFVKTLTGKTITLVIHAPSAMSYAGPAIAYLLYTVRKWRAATRSTA